ncbi:unnamed protein product, partial [Ectocarpus fasciculatus]
CSSALEREERRASTPSIEVGGPLDCCCLWLKLEPCSGVGEAEAAAAAAATWLVWCLCSCWSLTAPGLALALPRRRQRQRQEASSRLPLALLGALFCRGGEGVVASMACLAPCPLMPLRGLKCGAGSAAPAELPLLQVACGCQHRHGAPQGRWRSISSSISAPRRFMPATRMPPSNSLADVDIDQLLLELAGMDGGPSAEARSGEGTVEEEGWGGESGGDSFDDDNDGFGGGSGGGKERTRWKKRKRRRGWESEETPPLPASIGSLEQELLGMWDNSDGGGGANDYIKPGDKRGGIEGRRARRGRDYRRRGAGGGDRSLQDGSDGGGGGAISRAVSDEDLFESLFGDQRGGRVDVGGGATELAGEGGCCQ